MRVLVTGGAGYIGSHTAAHLINEGHSVTVLDSLIKGHKEAVPEAADFILGDMGDRTCLDRIFQEKTIDAVLHFAGFIEAGQSMLQPGLFFQNNTAKTITLLEAMVDHGVSKFVFSSTAAVYGDPEYIPIDEKHPKAPTNAYGATKLAVEGVLEWMCRLKGLAAISLRYFNASGCSENLGEDHRPETHLIPLILDVAMGKRQALKLFGQDYPTPDGTCVRDYIHVQDLAKAHALALQALTPGKHKSYNLGNGKGFSNLDVIETARRVTGHAIPFEYAPARPGDPARLVASAEKAGQELGWRPDFPELSQIVESAWRWRQRHPEGYSNTASVQGGPPERAG